MAFYKEDDLNEEIKELRTMNDNTYLECNNLKDRLYIIEHENNETIESLRAEIKRLKNEVIIIKILTLS